jgi:lysophospholipase L1-like esterase
MTLPKIPIGVGFPLYKGVEYINQMIEEVNGFQSQINQMVIEGDSSVEAAQARVDADGNAFTTLKERLDTADAQLEMKVTIRDIKDNVGFTDINKNLGRIDQTMVTDEFLQQMAGTTPINAIPADGSLVTKKYADKSVNALKTDFLTPSPNLFDKTTVISNKYVDPNNGNIADSANNDVSDYISVIPSTSYVKNVKGNVAFYNSSKTFLSGIPESTALAGTSFQAPSNAAYARFSIKKSEGYSKETTQFEVGQLPTEYIPFGTSFVDKQKLDIKKGLIITPSDTDFLLPSRNLFDKTKANIDKYVDPNNGNLFSATSTDTSDYIEISPSTNYVKNVKGHVAFYTSSKGYISGIHESTALANVSFQSPSNAVYLRFSIKKSEGYSVEEAQLERGQESTPYISFDAHSIDRSKIEVSEVGEGGKYKGLKMNFLGDSITAEGTYQTILQSELGLAVARNYGVGGTTLVGNGTDGLLDRYASMSDDADLVYVQGGTNDFSQDIPVSTFEADLRTLIEGLCQKYHGKTIIFATIPPRYVKYLGANNAGFTTLDYANKIKEVCAEYSIPVVDLHNESGINRFNMDLYMPDMVHPNYDGYVKLTNLIISKLKEIANDF